MTLIEVFSWNYGRNSAEKLTRIVNSYLLKQDRDIFVIGLQEVDHNDIESISQYLVKYLSKNYKVVIHSHSSLKFSLLTLIFYRKHKIKLVKPSKSEYVRLPNTESFASKIGSYLISTKGMLCSYVNFNVGNVIFSNVHLPFESREYTKKSINKILSYLNLRAYQNYAIVVLGDFNSRSLFNNTCLEKLERSGVVEFCPQKYEKNVDIKSVTNVEEKLNTCRVRPELRGCGNFSNALISNDVIWMDDLFAKNGFTEDQLYDLPSYKITVGEQQYSLQKKGKGRLPGYADRIIFSDEFTPEPQSYRVLSYTGNDHFPVVLKLTLEDINVSTTRSGLPYLLNPASPPLAFAFKSKVSGQKRMLTKGTLKKKSGVKKTKKSGVKKTKKSGVKKTKKSGVKKTKKSGVKKTKKSGVKKTKKSK